jgi:hypothetical protein
VIKEIYIAFMSRGMSLCFTECPLHANFFLRFLDVAVKGTFEDQVTKTVNMTVALETARYRAKHEGEYPRKNKKNR